MHDRAAAPGQIPQRRKILGARVDAGGRAVTLLHTTVTDQLAGFWRVAHTTR